MTSIFPRRTFLAGLGAVAVTATASAIPGPLQMLPQGPKARLKSPFRIAVISDEITQDFGRACEIAANDFGMEWIELRSMWNKNLLHLDSKELEEVRRILKKNQLRVTDIGSSLFKVNWPGAPKSMFAPKQDRFKADFTADQQDEVLDRSIELAKLFRTDRVRCFDFWRLDDQAPYRAAINEKLRHAAGRARKAGIVLVLENEAACNTGTAAEAAQVLAAVKSPNLMLNWDPGNAAERGEKPFPDGYSLLPKHRIGHCHCKNARKNPASGEYEWMPVGHGIVDWVGQFQALERDGYRLAVSLETHWRGAGTPEASTRQSWAEMKECLASGKVLRG